ncbi:MAG: hypothetical protein LRZ88_12400 [Candidatus Cloacimonetes bacterium]|nr:hypothetical protein [Candidatus Cloacimonadota bacterium]
MKILMFTWEFPPLISGGLRHGMLWHDQSFTQPRHQDRPRAAHQRVCLFSHARTSDADTLPVVFVDQEKHSVYTKKTFSTLHERMEYIGITEQPESYFQLADIRRDSVALKREYWLSETVNLEERELWQEMTTNLIGDEDLIRKVQEYTLRAERLPEPWTMI